MEIFHNNNKLFIEIMLVYEYFNNDEVGNWMARKRIKIKFYDRICHLIFNQINPYRSSAQIGEIKRLMFLIFAILFIINVLVASTFRHKET
jgi:hypothetical protein